jgi:hypothetical protein
MQRDGLRSVLRLKGNIVHREGQDCPLACLGFSFECDAASGTELCDWLEKTVCVKRERLEAVVF